MDDRTRARAAVHGALAEPIRLGLIDELAATDRSPKELSERLGLATNLLAHHLGVLEEAGLIERFVSAGDRRRRYIRLRREPLDRLGVGTGSTETTRVLFVCTHNSARSQLAAALWTARTGGRASSAGTHPAPRVHPGAIAAARRAGLDLRRARPRTLQPTERADQVITVCDRAHEELDPAPSWWHWSIDDPVPIGTGRAFDRTVAEIDARIRSVSGVSTL